MRHMCRDSKIDNRSIKRQRDQQKKTVTEEMENREGMTQIYRQMYMVNRSLIDERMREREKEEEREK